MKSVIASELVVEINEKSVKIVLTLGKRAVELTAHRAMNGAGWTFYDPKKASTKVTQAILDVVNAAVPAQPQQSAVSEDFEEQLKRVGVK